MSKSTYAPLSKTQMGIYMDSMSAPESTLYNLPLLGKLGEDIDVDRLKDAICKSVKAHPGLNTHIFYDENGNFGDYIEFGQENVEASKLEIEIKHINGNIYEIKFTGGVDEEGNSVNGYYKGEVDMFEE